MAPSERPASPLPPNPPPWTCHADIYAIPFFLSSSDLASLPPSFLHAPLEAAHEPALTRLTKPVGGLGMIQIIRYKHSPVGPYDELFVMPGSYSWARVQEDAATGKKGEARRVEGTNPRVTRIYVSQRDTCHYDWSIPKHLASFTFTTNADSSLTLELRPHPSDNDDDDDGSAPSSSTPPFFTTTFRPTPYAPPFPVSLSSLSLFTQTRIVLPPLPADESDGTGLVCGTDMWCAFTPKVTSWKTRVGWFDMRQSAAGDDDNGDDDGGGDKGKGENFWPGWGRWRFGLCMKDAQLVFEEPQTWKHTDARELKSPCFVQDLPGVKGDKSGTSQLRVIMDSSSISISRQR